MEKLNAIALTLLRSQFTLEQLVKIYHEAGSASALVEARTHLDDVLPDPTEKLKSAMTNMDAYLKRAEQEIAFCEKHSIKILTLNDADYPRRLAECPDAPLVLYFLGNGDLNAPRILNIIGTRKCTPYGRDIIDSFVGGLKNEVPDALVVSGLAYGIDICAHRAALNNGMNTVGVLAHGLDTIYPAVHRDTATVMTKHGGVLTEFMSGERPEKRNFVQRNRIVAGMSDFTILVESAERGGGLITCNIAQSYGRDVFAFPGQINSPTSAGCNRLLRDGKAKILTSVHDFLADSHWKEQAELEKAKREGIELGLFVNLNPTEETIAKALKAKGDLHINQLSLETNLPISDITTNLLIMEMNGIVRAMAGGMYHLIQ